MENGINWQAVATFFAAGSSLAAFITAYVLYRTRPLATRAIELHTQAIKDYLQASLIQDFPHFTDIYKYDVYDHPLDELYSYKQLISSELFGDLHYHIPDSNTLLDDIDRFKERWQEAEIKRKALIDGILDYFSQIFIKLGISISRGSELNTVWEFHFPNQYYLAMVRLAIGFDHEFKDLENKASGLVITGSGPYELQVAGESWARVKSQTTVKKLKSSFVKLVREMPTHPLFKQARVLNEMNDYLFVLRNQIIKEAQSLVALPLLPNTNCPLLKTSSEPLFGPVKTLLRQIRTKRKKNQPQPQTEQHFSPSKYGLVFFSLYVSTLATAPDSEFVVWFSRISLVLSLIMLVAVFNLSIFRRVHSVLDSGFGYASFTVYITAYFSGWLSTLSDVTADLRGVIIVLIAIWLITLLLVFAAPLPRIFGQRFSLSLVSLLWIPAIASLVGQNYIGGILLLVILCLLYLTVLERIKIHDNVSSHM